MTHLLVTNDFPPKVGGIQSYLWELWRRLPSETFCVFTTPHPDAAAWDAEQPFRVERVDEKVLLPTFAVRGRIRELAAEVGASLVMLDPALPLGALGPRLGMPYGLVLHGAEVTVPGRLAPTRFVLRRVLRGARLVVAAGGYPLAEAERAAGRTLPAVVVPPGVDPERFRPLDPVARRAARARLGLPEGALVVAGISRLVPRKGFDVLLRAAAEVSGAGHRELLVVIAGAGRDRARLERIAARCATPVRFLGRVPDEDLPDLYGAADLFAMLCRNRWAGLEQEGFGIVFLEAAAAGVPQLAGASGGSHEAVLDGVTGRVVHRPTEVAGAVAALEDLLEDPEVRRSMGEAARRRAVEEFGYDVLAARLGEALRRCEDGLRGP